MLSPTRIRRSRELNQISRYQMSGAESPRLHSHECDRSPAKACDWFSTPGTRIGSITTWRCSGHEKTTPKRCENSFPPRPHSAEAAEHRLGSSRLNCVSRQKLV